MHYFILLNQFELIDKVTELYLTNDHYSHYGMLMEQQLSANPNKRGRNTNKTKILMN